MNFYTLSENKHPKTNFFFFFLKTTFFLLIRNLDRFFPLYLFDLSEKISPNVFHDSRKVSRVKNQVHHLLSVIIHFTYYWIQFLKQMFRKITRYWHLRNNWTLTNGNLPCLREYSKIWSGKVPFKYVLFNKSKSKMKFFPVKRRVWDHFTL